MNFKNIAFGLCATFFALPIFAQDYPGWPKPSAASKAYNKFKAFTNKSLTVNAKVATLVKANKKVKTDSDERGITQKNFDNLTTAELVTYCLTYAESFNQVCDIKTPIENEEKKILPFIAEAYEDYTLSTRQVDALKAKKTDVVNLLMAGAAKEKRIGVNYKAMLLAIGATNAIPQLINFYKASVKKDTDILTVLNTLMYDAKYTPFMQSTTYQKLYADNTMPESERFIDFNKANEALILTRAQEFYASL